MDAQQPRNGSSLWWNERVARRVVLGLACAVLAIQLVRIVNRGVGDFKVHWTVAGNLLTGSFLYGDAAWEQGYGGNDHPYPPLWGVLHVPFAMLPRAAAQTVLYPLFLAAFALLVAALNRLVLPHLPVEQSRRFWLTAAAVVLSIRYLVRDLPECGVNLALVAAAWCAVLLWQQRRERLGGLVLGAATALKCTPALFIAWFVWKRQWRMASWSVVAALAFSVAPVLWFGPAEFTRTTSFWLHNVYRGMNQPSPAVGALGPVTVQNMSLQASLARFLMHLPEGHPSRAEAPYHLDVFNLSPRAASVTIKLLIAAAGLLILHLWRTTARRDSEQILWEAAGVSVLILLLSPITWGQHCVGVLPAWFLLVRSHAAGRPLERWMYGFTAMWVVVVLGLNREILGRDLTLLLDSYRVQTWLIAGLLAVVVRCRVLCERAGWTAATDRLAEETSAADDPRGLPGESSTTPDIAEPARPAAA